MEESRAQPRSRSAFRRAPAGTLDRLSMRVLAIGDIHGSIVALETLLAAVAPTPTDLIVTLGDYVDRGPRSCEVIEKLLALQATGRLVALLGNHDQMMLDARAGVAKLVEGSEG